jgi:hypothetical protein
MVARTARKQLLDAIACGDQTIPTVLDRAKTDTIVGRTKVAALVKSLPGYGLTKVTAAPEQAGIARSRPGRTTQRRPRVGYVYE